MKKLFLLFAFIFCFLSYGQITKFNVAGYKQVTTAQKNGLTVPSGEFWVVYDSTLSRYDYWDGDSWEPLVSGSGATQLNELTDVTSATQTAGFVIISDGGNYFGRALTESDISDLGTYLTQVLDDPTPQLGGNLDVNSFSFVTTSSGDITFDPDGTGVTNIFSTLYVYDTSSNSNILGDGGGILVGYVNSTSNYIYGNGGLIVNADGTITAPNMSIAEINTAGSTALITKEYADANYASGSGDVTAAVNFANDNRVIRSDGTTKGVQASGVTLDDSNNLSGALSVTTGTNDTTSGSIYAYGNTTTGGGVFRIYNGATVDTENDYYQIYGTVLGDLFIDATTDGTLFAYDVSTGNIALYPEGTGNIILGTITIDADQVIGAGQDNYVLTYDNATGLISLEASVGGATNLTSVHNATDVVVESDTGTDATINLANGTTAGVTENNLTDAEKTVLGNTSGTNSGDQTATLTAGTGLAGTTYDPDTNSTFSLAVDELSEKSGNLVGTDRLTGTSGTTNFSETISNIPLNIFSNNLTNIIDNRVAVGNGTGIEGTINFTFDSSTGLFRVGQLDTSVGEMDLTGGAASVGGRLDLFNGATVDDDDDYYIIQANSVGDFSIGGSNTSTFFTFDSGNQNVRLNDYGGGTKTGTAAYMMAFDANGIIIEEPLPSGGESTTVSDTNDIDLTLTGSDITADLLPTAISSKALVTAVSTDMVLLWDATDSQLKRADVSDFGGGGTIGGAITDNQVAIGATTANEIEGTSNLTFIDAQSRLFVGENDTTKGWLRVLGSSSNFGGSIELFNGASSDTANEYFTITTDNGNFTFNADTDGNFLQYEQSLARWNMQKGNLLMGTNDVEDGSVSLMGNNTTQGASLYMYNAANVDTENEAFEVLADSNGDFKISGLQTGQFFKYDSGTTDITLGNYTLDGDQTVGAVQDNFIMTYDNGTGLISLEANTGGSGDDVSTFAEKSGALVGTDRLVGLSGATDFSETISGIPLSIFNNDSGWTSNAGDMVLASTQTNTGAKTFNDNTLLLDDSDSAFNLILGSTSTITTADKKLTFDVNDANRTLTLGGDTTLNGGTHSGTNTGDQTITLTGDVTGSGTGSFATTIANGAVDIAHLSATGTPDGTTYLRGDNTWATVAGGGDVSKVGTPVDNQVGVWTGDGTIEGTSGLTYTGSDFSVTGSGLFTSNLQVSGGSFVAGQVGVQGVIQAHGAATASNDGGQLSLLLADDFDTTINSYIIKGFQDDLLIETDLGTDLLTFDFGADNWISNKQFEVPTEVYGVGWDASNEVPTKDAVYDKIETLGGGGDMLLGTAQTVTALKTFNTGTFALRNPANTFSYNFLGSAITADRTVTLPLLTGNDTFTMNDFAQTLTNKTLTSPVINTQISGTVTSGGNITTTNYLVGATATQTLTNKSLTSPTLTGTPILPSTYTIGANSFIRSGAHNLTLTTTAATNVTLPTTGTLATLAGTETLTNKTIAFANNTLTNVMSLTTAQSVTAGIKKTFQADATNAGLRLQGVTTNPSTLVAGDLWYRTDTEKLSYRGASAARSLVAETLAATLTNKTIALGSNTVTGTTAQFNTAVTDGNFIYEGSKSITVESPTASEDISMFFTNKAITITEMRAVVRGTTPSVTWTIRHSTDRSATGNQVVTGGTTTTSQTTGSDVVSFNDATIPADSFVWLETTAATGTNNEINISVIYTED